MSNYSTLKTLLKSFWCHCYCLSSTLGAACVCTHAHKAHTHRHSPSYTCSEAVGSEFSICQHDHLVYLHIMAFSTTIWRNGSRRKAKIKRTCTWMGRAPLLAEKETRESPGTSQRVSWAFLKAWPEEEFGTSCVVWWWAMLPYRSQDGYLAVGMLKCLSLRGRKQTNLQPLRCFPPFAATYTAIGPFVAG